MLILMFWLVIAGLSIVSMLLTVIQIKVEECLYNVVKRIQVSCVIQQIFFSYIMLRYLQNSEPQVYAVGNERAIVLYRRVAHFTTTPAGSFVLPASQLVLSIFCHRSFSIIKKSISHEKF
ncbi:unnamed protein product [Angiostrongylus costaricensis]|uniref:Secreted protein n=1 Tax=Angiostrongylus costaricensis TaxID=334426 RepID=A0A0R3PRT0_ANGCS|nr:unnamed protein product [Angiostrongylus costaricensis]